MAVALPFLGEIRFEAEYCPEVLQEWSSVSKNKEGKKGDRSGLSLRAKKHLSALGFVFKYVQKGTGRELRYFSPSGRCFYSLRTACLSCIDGNGVNLGNLGLIQHQHNPNSSKHCEETYRLSASEHCEEAYNGVNLGNLQLVQHEESRNYSQHCEETYRPSSFKHCEETFRPRELVLGLGAKSVLFSGNKSRGNKCASASRKRRVADCVDSSEVLVKVRRGKIKNLKKQKIDEESNHRNKWMREELEDHGGAIVALETRKVILFGIRSDPDDLLSESMRRGYEGHRINNWEETAKEEDINDPAKFNETVVKFGKGKSLSKLIELMDPKRKACRRSGRSRKPPDIPNHDFNEDTCRVCRYGGELVLCDNCPFAFHHQCLGLTDVPKEDHWFCPSCLCGSCGTRESKAENLMRCYQCSRKFHSGCLNRDIAMVDDPSWFCSTMCERVHLSLQNLVGKEIKIKDQNLSLTFLKPPMDHKIQVNHKAKLRRAIGVLHESFESSKNPSTGSDLVEDVVYGRLFDSREKNSSGFYTIVLESNKKVISAAIVRIYRDLAEVPLVATRLKHRKKGMCRILMNELEKQLMDVGIQRLVLPAAPSLVEYWTGRFGFSEMKSSERLKLLHHSFLDFQDTVMCHKVLMKRPNSDKSTLIL